MTPIRCPKCDKLIGYLEGKGEFMCPRCKDKRIIKFNTEAPKPEKVNKP